MLTVVVPSKSVTVSCKAELLPADPGEGVTSAMYGALKAGTVDERYARGVVGSLESLMRKRAVVLVFTT